MALESTGGLPHCTFLAWYFKIMIFTSYIFFFYFPQVRNQKQLAFIEFSRT